MTTQNAPVGLLTGKNAILYGGTGILGRTTALTFAREGATLFLCGRTKPTLDEVAGEITALGGTVHTAVLDATDEQAVRDHLDAVVAEHGHVDVSLNLIRRGDVQGKAYVDMTPAEFLEAMDCGLRSVFITATAAARQMSAQGSGTILFVTSGSGAVTKPDPSFAMGNTGPTDAATESFLHYLASEVGPKGVRVNGIWTAGVEYGDLMATVSMLKVGPTKQQFADAAVWLSCDRASGTTNAILDASSGVCSP
jgi:NAD(P)-dependent dehydrogenase (short-subunit alcohol dehydrogenase family)